MKLYLVTRKDLTPGQRAAQLCHALRAFVEEHPTVDQEWFATSNTLVLLETGTEADLQELVQKARPFTPVSVFQETDLDNAVTAIAIGPAGRRLVRHLPLALAT